MKYVTFMPCGFVPVSVLFSHHLLHEEIFASIGHPIIGAGIANIAGGVVRVSRCTSAKWIPDSLDAELIAHDLRLTPLLLAINSHSNTKTHVPR